MVLVCAPVLFQSNHDGATGRLISEIRDSLNAATEQIEAEQTQSRA